MKLFPKINIVVLNCNGKDVLKKCLAGLFRLNYPNFEVVVADNNSTDGSLENARRDFSRATFIKNEQDLGFSAGNNIGIRYSLEKMANFIFLLSSQLEIDKNCLTKLTEAAEKNPEAGIFSPIIFSGNSDKVYFSGGKIDWWRMKSICHSREGGNPDFISGDAMFIRAEVFKKIGLLDEDFFLSWGDIDFSFRAKKAGFSLLVASDSTARYFENSDKENKSQGIYWQTLSELMFFQKNSPRFLKPWVAFCIFLRKVKNQFDVRKNKTEINLAVRKAYEDFGGIGKSKKRSKQDAI
ncbi:MAG TPA: hypothetical protein DCS28_03730 [Candidatus Moranbacteria bacterium]|nr:hypothetical protein [Candidatus Moranbacteria bacterium]HAT75121.1 hypothetical protein [Candidatus Moranbacteria bacterium]